MPNDFETRYRILNAHHQGRGKDVTDEELSNWVTAIRKKKHQDGDEEKAQYRAKCPLYKLAPQKSSEIKKRKQNAHHAFDVLSVSEVPVF
jgi:hypothetical protein